MSKLGQAHWATPGAREGWGGLAYTGSPARMAAAYDAQFSGSTPMTFTCIQASGCSKRQLLTYVHGRGPEEGSASGYSELCSAQSCLGMKSFHCKTDSGDQATAADRYQDDINVWHLRFARVDQLQSRDFN